MDCSSKLVLVLKPYLKALIESVIFLLPHLNFDFYQI